MSLFRGFRQIMEALNAPPAPSEPSREEFLRRAYPDVSFIAGRLMTERGIDAASALAAVHEAVPVGHEYMLFYFDGLVEVAIGAAAILGVEPPSLVSGTVH